MPLLAHFTQVILAYSIYKGVENVYMGKLLKYSKKYWIQITLAAVSSVTASVSTVMIIDILKLIIDQIAGGTLKQTIHFIVIKMLIVICAGIVSNYMVVAMTGFIGAGLLQNLRNDAVNALMKASPEYINKCNYGDMMERITEDIEGLAGFMSRYFKDCLYSIFIFNESAIGGNMSDATCNYSSNQYKAFKTNKIAPAPVCKGAGAD